MTATESQDRERQRRISVRWDNYPHYAYADIAAAIDVELAQEARDRAEGEAWVKDMTDGMKRLAACNACGEHRGLGERTGYCPACSRVAAQVTAERRGADMIAGHTRRQLVEAFLDRTKAT